jgi:hypothetical protein
MALVAGDKAVLADYNGTYYAAMAILTQGGIGYGYGQYPYPRSGNVSSTTVLGSSEWNALRYDLFNIRAHQIGTNPAITVAASTGNLISATDPTTFTDAIITYNTDRGTAHASRVTTSTSLNNGPVGGLISRTAAWRTSVQTIIRQQFFSSGSFASDPTQVAAIFYNTGGAFKIAPSRTGGATSAQNTAWTALLTSVGTLSFGYSDYVNFYTNFAGQGWRSWYTKSDSAPYALNSFNIEVQMINPYTIEFRITFVDLYSDPSPGDDPAPDDIVDGTLSLNLSQQFNPGGHTLSPSPPVKKWLGFTSTLSTQVNGDGSSFQTYVLPTYYEVKSGTWALIGG